MDIFHIDAQTPVMQNHLKMTIFCNFSENEQYRKQYQYKMVDYSRIEIDNQNWIRIYNIYRSIPFC